MEVKASLKGPGEGYHDEIVWLKIVEPDKPKEGVTTKEDENTDNIGLPELIKVNKEQWSNLSEIGAEMDHQMVMFPLGEGDKLEKIYVNLDSQVFLNHRKKLKSEDQITTSQKKYLVSVYFHSLFLYMITKRKNYKFSITVDEKDQDVTIDEYIRDVFDSYYSDFLLNFGMEQLMNSLDE